MKETDNLKLNFWDGNDRVKREDFNADNEKIDAGYEELIKKCEQLGIDIENIDVTEELDALAEELRKEIEKKVTKEDGKGLSANDYTNEDKALVGTIKDKADKPYVDEQDLKLQQDIEGKYEELNDRVSQHTSDISNKADKTYVDEKDESLMKEIDSVKLSGVESNKILVDALNSKEVQASTSDTIKTNVQKVNDIEVGDYKIGDILYNSDIEKTVKDRIGEFSDYEWRYYHRYGIYAIAQDNNSGFIYAGGNDSNVWKISPEGQKIWSFYYFDSVSSIVVDDEGFIYVGGDRDSVVKLSPDGEEVWEFKRGKQFEDIISIALDKYGSPFIAYSDRIIIELNSNGTIIKEYTGYDSGFYSVAVDDNGYIYTSDRDYKVIKTSPFGEKKWEYIHDTFFNSIELNYEIFIRDPAAFIYAASSYGEVIKINPNGNRVWEKKTREGYDNYSIVSDNKGYIYVGGVGYVAKLDLNSNEIWRFTKYGNAYATTVDNDGYVYSTLYTGIVKINGLESITYKIIK